MFWGGLLCCNRKPVGSPWVDLGVQLSWPTASKSEGANGGDSGVDK